MKKKFSLFVLVFAMLLLVGCTTKNEDFSLFNSGLLAVEKNNKWGYINNKNETVIEFNYDEAYAFKDGHAIVQIGDKYTVIDTLGKSTLNKGYDNLNYDLETGLLLYSLNSRWGLMDVNEKILSEPFYDWIFSFEEGLALVKLNDKFGFIDKKGKLAIPLDYDDASGFSQGLVAVKKGDKYGYIDKNNNIKIDFFYDEAYSFDEYKRAHVRDHDNDIDKLIDMSGKVIMEGSSITTGGPLYAVKEKEDGKYNIYDYDKKKFSGQEFNNVYYFHRYFARVNDLDNEYLFFWFNEDGTVLASGDYYKTDYIPKELNQEGFEVPEDYFMIEDEDYLKVFTKTKNYQFSLDYEVMQFLKDEKFIVKKDDKYGIIDKDSTIIINLLYDYLVKLSDGYYLYGLNDKYGVMNNKFEIIIPAEYDGFEFDNSPYMYYW